MAKFKAGDWFTNGVVYERIYKVEEFCYVIAYTHREYGPMTYKLTIKMLEDPIIRLATEEEINEYKARQI